jgi:hypothetical protein
MQVSCEWSTRCGYFPDVSTCKASTTLDWDQLLASVSSGKTQFDGAAAAAFLEQRRTEGCNWSDVMDNSDSTSLAVFRGTLPGGATCAGSWECVSFDCDTSACTQVQTACCAGKCAAATPVDNPVPAGGDCSSELAVCADGTYCYTWREPYTCAVGLKLGEACNPSSSGMDDPSNHCLHSAHCKPSNSARGGTCTRPPVAGETCDPSGPIPSCDPINTYCDSSSHICRLRGTAGTACTDDEGCVPYARCDLAKGTCVALGTAGETCDATASSPCLGSLECTNGKCELPAPVVCL